MRRVKTYPPRFADSWPRRSATLQSAITGLPAYIFNAAGVNDATFARADAQYVQQLPQLVSAYSVDHEILSTLQDNSAFLAPLIDAGLLSTGLRWFCPSCRRLRPRVRAPS